MVGGFVPVSSTVTIKLQLPPPVSEVTLTSVDPTGKNDPEAGVDVIAPQVPDCSAASNVTCAPRWLPSVVLATAFTLSGQLRVHVPPPPPVGTKAEALEELSSGRISQVESGAQGVALLEMLAKLVTTVPGGVPVSTE